MCNKCYDTGLVNWDELDEWYGNPPEDGDQTIFPCDCCCGDYED